MFDINAKTWYNSKHVSAKEILKDHIMENLNNHAQQIISGELGSVIDVCSIGEC